jgi:6-phosphogluconolactonase (cycloisomerase 2 family)
MQNCTQLDRLSPSTSSQSMAISPDGRHLYLVGSHSNGDGNLIVMERDPLEGDLNYLGCLNSEGSDGCQSAIGLNRMSSILVSPDGRNVYVTGGYFGNSAISVFQRDLSTGSLHQLTGSKVTMTKNISSFNGPFKGCVSSSALLGCELARGINGPHQMSLVDHTFYVNSQGSRSVAIFRRNHEEGDLVQLSGEDGCVNAYGGDGCSPVILPSYEI